jgi:S1-C subfamily serine protease
LTDEIDRGRSRDLALEQVTKGGKPSGILVRDDWFVSTSIKAGDVIRKVDGVAVTTIDALLGALGRAKDHPKIELDVDRIGLAIAATVVLEDPPKQNPEIAAGIAKINQWNDTTYEVPRSLIDAGLMDPLAAVKGARILPNMMNGTPIGYKVYAIQPDSLVAKLGIMNGDTLISIDDQDVAATSREFDLREKLRTATELKLVIERHGKALTFVYKIK